MFDVIMFHIKSSPLYSAISGAAAVIIVLCVLRFLPLALKKMLRGKRRPTALDSVTDGYGFEEYIAGLLIINGFTEVNVTKKSGDYGVDVLAEKDGVLFAAQCKLYNQPVGVKAVQEVLSGRIFYNRHVGIVATNNYFTENARRLAEKTGILLWDRDRLIDLEQNYSGKRRGVVK